MARALRIEQVGLTFHVWAHGVAELPLFRAPDAKDTFLKLLRDEVAISDWTCLEYAVMTTHYHLLLRLNKLTLSSGFKRLNVRFAQDYNKLHGRRGHVFDGRFGSKLIGTSFDQMEVARYIALNPVRARICDSPEEWPWSSHGSLAGLFPRDPIVDRAAALAPLKGSGSAYRRYVLEHDKRVRWGQVGARPLEVRRLRR